MSKKFCIRVIGVGLLVLFLLGGITVVIDPYFHYHAPLRGLSYPLNMDTQRYQNMGILEHCDYDAVITGTSMTENFRVSQMEALFGVQGVKTPCSGGSYKEIDGMVQRALETHLVKMVVRCLDYTMLVKDKDESYETDAAYPAYLMDDSLVNDVSYFLNKDVLFSADMNVILHTLRGRPSMDFDGYSNWDATAGYGRDVVVQGYDRPEWSERQTLSEAERKMIRDNVRQNVVANAEKYPHTQFYYFFPPYSICYWDKLVRQGKLEYMLEAEAIAAEEILQCENIHLYSFADMFEVTTDLGNYKDYIHYSGAISSLLLEEMQGERYLLNKENFADYQNRVGEFYKNYDYDAAIGE